MPHQAVGAPPPFAWWPGDAADADVVEALETVLALGSRARYPSRWGASGS